MPGTDEVLAFPVYPGVTPLDLIGPLTVLKTPGIRGARYRTVVVGERAEQLATDTPLQLVPAATFAEVPEPWAVVVPGGGAATLAAATEDDALLTYVRSAAAGAEVVGSTGNGALVLAAADLLHGKRAAVHWATGSRWRSWVRSPPPSGGWSTAGCTPPPAAPPVPTWRCSCSPGCAARPSPGSAS